MGNQSRVRHARREFVRAYPQTAEMIQKENAATARALFRVSLLRNAIILVVGVGLLVLRCGPW